MTYISQFKSAVIPINTALSNVVDLVDPYSEILVIVPALTGTKIEIHVSMDGTTFYALYGWYLATPANITITASKGGVVRIGGIQYIKINAPDGNEGAERTIYIRGLA